MSAGQGHALHCVPRRFCGKHLLEISHAAIGSLYLGHIKTNRWLISRMSQLGGVESTPDPLGVGCGCGPLQLKLLLVHEGSHLLRPKMLNLNTLFKAIMLSL